MQRLFAVVLSAAFLLAVGFVGEAYACPKGKKGPKAESCPYKKGAKAKGECPYKKAKGECPYKKKYKKKGTYGYSHKYGKGGHYGHHHSSKHHFMKKYAAIKAKKLAKLKAKLLQSVPPGTKMVLRKFALASKIAEMKYRGLLQAKKAEIANAVFVEEKSWNDVEALLKELFDIKKQMIKAKLDGFFKMRAVFSTPEQKKLFSMIWVMTHQTKHSLFHKYHKYFHMKKDLAFEKFDALKAKGCHYCMKKQAWVCVSKEKLGPHCFFCKKKQAWECVVKDKSHSKCPHKSFSYTKLFYPFWKLFSSLTPEQKALLQQNKFASFGEHMVLKAKFMYERAKLISLLLDPSVKKEDVFAQVDKVVAAKFACKKAKAFGNYKFYKSLNPKQKLQAGFLKLKQFKIKGMIQRKAAKAFKFFKKLTYRYTFKLLFQAKKAAAQQKKATPAAKPASK